MAGERGQPLILKEEEEFRALVETNTKFLTVASFIAPWSENCAATKELTRELISDPDLLQVVFLEVDAEEFPSICRTYEVKSVPTIVFIRNKQVIDRLVGADVRNYALRVVSLANDGPAVDGIPVKIVPKVSSAAPERTDESLTDRLQRLINKSNVMIFMKGNPSQPKCGFSRQIIELINATGVRYQTFDILEDDVVRQGLKDFSNWQTYPQVYVSGELIGGLDIIRDMNEMGNLMDVLNGKNPT